MIFWKKCSRIFLKHIWSLIQNIFFLLFIFLLLHLQHFFSQKFISSEFPNFGIVFSLEFVATINKVHFLKLPENICLDFVVQRAFYKWAAIFSTSSLSNKWNIETEQMWTRNKFLSATIKNWYLLWLDIDIYTFIGVYDIWNEAPIAIVWKFKDWISNFLKGLFSLRKSHKIF